MFTEERRNYILQETNKLGSVRTSELAHKLNVTNETIRKDIVALCDMGLVTKEFGGASAVQSNEVTPVNIRLAANTSEKVRIGLRAIEFITDNSTIFLDAGSSIAAFVKHLPPLPSATVVTNSFALVPDVLNMTNQVYFLGGELMKNTLSTNGSWSEQALHSLSLDIAFLGTDGFASHNGPGSSLFQDAQIKQRIMNISKKKIVLADSRKFTNTSFLQYAQWSDIDVLITTSETPEELLEPLQNLLEIIVVD